MLAGGAAAGQLLLVVSSPVVTRLYTPADFGTYAVYGSLIGILTATVALGYEYAVTLPEEDSEAANVLALVGVVVVAMAGLVAVVIVVGGEAFINATNAAHLGGYIWIVPFGLLGAGSYRAVKYWAIRQRSYAPIAATKLYQGGAHAGTQISLGLLGAGPLGLILGQVVGQIAGVGRLTRVMATRWDMIRRAVTVSGIIAAARRYRRFPLFTGPGAFLNAGGLYVPAILFSAMYGPAVAGWFMLGHRLVGLPVSLVSKSVAQVYLGESAHQVRESPHLVRQRFHRAAGRLALLVALPAAGLLIFAPPLFAFVFGGAWREAGSYVQLLTAMFVGRFVVTSLTHTLTILERQDRQFLWDLGRLVLVVAAITIPAMLQASARVAVLSYSLAMLAAYGVLYLIMDVSLARHRR